ncbi:hypothetical protein CHLRE_01g003650v5 [Chlamydomonas reinhardtii]|nr:uncharacterized protein CHLRE_01g003650v5 [Chlamydomonas reinhardtii]PNW87833.1 hypothetical protein CHLRE_01g003650v5 [Chlamydomonas reinhardtii]
MVLEYFIPSTVTVTPSQCSSGKRNQIEGLMRIKYDYRPDLLAPCCFGHLPVSAACPPAFEWPNPSKEDAEENVTSALACLAKLAPEGVVVLPVQDITWLQAEVVIDKTTIEISSGRTDYIFVTKAAWARCQEEYGAKLQGRTLKVDAGHTPSEALHSMLGSICGLYEAKSPASMLHDGVPKVRAQAVLEYVVINQMAEWPEDDVVVLFGDLNTHYAVHAGRNDPDRNAKRSLHVAGPARLQDAAEGSPATAAYSHPASITAAFLTALLCPRGNDATETRMEGAGSSGGGGTGGSGEGAGGNQQGGDATFHSGGATNAHDGGAGRSKQDASGSGGGPTGGNKDAHSSAGAADRGGEGSVIGADSSDEGGGFDGDEGLREAAQTNWDAQVFMSLLRLPEVYQALGLSQPPTSFRPPTKEEFLAGFRPWEE